MKRVYHKGDELTIEKFNPKFCFLNTSDAYHQYYAIRLEECKAGKVSTIQPRQNAPTPAPVRDTYRPDKPRDWKFSAAIPGISAQDLDIIKLTAQYVAKNGRSFITTLSHREQKNYQFDFLKSNHSLYPYFNVLVTQYSQVLERVKVLDEKCLERCRRRAEYIKSQEQADLKSIQEQEKERVAYGSIDWHSFTIVETIQFTQGDIHAQLAPAMNRETLRTASLEQKAIMKTSEQPTLAIAPPPQLRGSQVTQQSGKQQCPRCGGLFASHEIEEHMRVELLDPKWKEQKSRADQKRSSTNLYVDDAAANLRSLKRRS